MTHWSPQRYRSLGQRRGIDPSVLENAVRTGNITCAANPHVPTLFSLKHLAYRSGVDYSLLRAIVERRDPEPYRTFKVRKRSSSPQHARYRVIAVPSPALMRVQKWIAQRILAVAPAHSASTAYGKNCNISDAVLPHCSSRWLIKLDVRSFFESISESAAYGVFRKLGYQPLISFELARICTRVYSKTRLRSYKYWDVEPARWSAIPSYQYFRKGSLPQGAPTSPMLANLAVRQFDANITAIAEKYGLIYTRYADDLALSTSGEFSRQKCHSVIQKVYGEMRAFGLSPNATKTAISPPGARKLLLGLLVDTDRPKLTREFRAKLRQHVFFLQSPKAGPVKHARHLGFQSLIGFRHHIHGLVNYAYEIEPAFGERYKEALKAVEWPL
ncbi:RNA-directed DNA polymerase [Dyella solisilvae]|uniref:RNA-directed DNA polymerase n=1 Tax=Dyella solisilvae TaxID=1920168 RepID=A0A370K3W0_9GAMM|nr:RNA-directed DNA polymerase [Dyella solisilvae]